MITDKDKPQTPPDPTQDQPATTSTPSGTQSGTTPSTDEAQTDGDYVVVGSGLGIDE